ncbi:MAG: AraC family transcriptional regulator [Verrucomicrobiota bacterium]|nr:AraC family transcriptional regulator [Verrucomicrobiota bacterium]
MIAFHLIKNPFQKTARAQIALICHKLPYHSSMKNVYPLGVGYLNASPDWRYPAHKHKHHEIIVILKGQLKVIMHGKTFLAKSGDLLLYHANVSHDEFADKSNPPQTLFMGIPRSYNLSGIPPHVHDSNRRVSNLLRWIQEEQFCHNPASSAAQIAFLEAIIVELQRLSGNRENPLIEKIRSFICDRLSSDLTVDDLAQVAQLSKFAFIRKYKKVSGYTPMEEVRKIRLETARQLLLSQNLPLKEIAPQVGYGDEFQLSRALRKIYGTGARKLRASIK